MITITITPLTLTKRRFITLLKMMGINPWIKFIIPNQFNVTARLFDYIALSNYTMEPYNAALPLTIMQIVEQRGRCTFIDIGASIGDTVLLAEEALRKENSSEIYFVEGDPEFYSMAIENTKNAPHLVKGFNTFLAEKDEELSSISIEKTSANLTLKNSDNSTGSTVKFRSLDSIAVQHSIIPNFIKIDVEGFEFKVLKGASSLLKQYRPCILFECNVFTENDPELHEMFSFFEVHGYTKSFFFTNHGLLAAALPINDIKSMRKLLSKIDGKTLHFYDVLVYDDSFMFSFPLLETSQL